MDTETLTKMGTETLTIQRAPFPWFGGKSRAAELIWGRLGPVANYVEPFATAKPVVGYFEISL